ncbi:SRPBCC domain-containing protein [Sphingosinicella sp. LHD-64]|uniref:SRPBCC family protein n=1 Tax=Sphingosinicella sp. LHD-64 TaxID=3072139 RepID=UPI0028102953|nr:SRPBCC domain-containing protein [Sphingosinicella sp. LHD-64]MDQ8756353.1 SRPBCC domain-containing protein [Sphingosinicella sp. LHD-64]
MKGMLVAFALLAAAPAPAQDVAVSEQRDPAGTLVLSHEVVVAAPPDAVWAAISTPEGWRTWAAPVARSVDGAPDLIETSYTPTAGPNDQTTIRQQVLARIPGRLLVFRTVKAPGGFPHFDTYRQVVSIFELIPEGRATRVRLTGTNYADNDAGRQLLGFFRAGNRVSLEQLRDRFVRGPVDWVRRRSEGH